MFDTYDFDWTAFVDNLTSNAEGMLLYSTALTKVGADASNVAKEVKKVRNDATAKSMESILTSEWSTVVE